MSTTASDFEGYLDRVENGWIFGWAWRPASPNDSVALEVYVDGVLEATVSATLYRADLESGGMGNGRHAFEISLRERLMDGSPHEVRVRYAGTGMDVHGSPRGFAQDRGATAAADVLLTNPSAQVTGPRFRSRFGGLWTDLSIALELINGKASLGWISAEEASLLRCWVEDGYVVLSQAVSAESIDRLDAEVERIWAGNASVRTWVEVWEDGRPMISPSGPRYKERLNKLLDLYMHFEPAREVVFSPRIVRFLSLVFERPALAFQSLYFRWGSQQDIHQDTAFVKVSSPMEFAASWIALEDVQPGSGELEYFVGSHKLDDYLFDGRYKWMPTKSTEYHQYVAALRLRSEERGLRRERFLPKKGDVLLWASDLGHGGSQDVRPGLTRRSIVTHYCPVNCDPVYADGVSSYARRQHNSSAYYTAQRRDRAG